MEWFRWVCWIDLLVWGMHCTYSNKLNFYFYIWIQDKKTILHFDIRITVCLSTISFIFHSLGNSGPTSGPEAWLGQFLQVLSYIKFWGPAWATFTRLSPYLRPATVIFASLVLYQILRPDLGNFFPYTGFQLEMCFHMKERNKGTNINTNKQVT